MGSLGVHVNAPHGGREEIVAGVALGGTSSPPQLAATVPAATDVHGIDVHLSTE
jgi:hypothetical protein